MVDESHVPLACEQDACDRGREIEEKQDVLPCEKVQARRKGSVQSSGRVLSIISVCV